MTTAFLFPGQGSQAVGMGKALADAHPTAARIFDEADRILGWPLRTFAWEGPDEELRRTDRTQPALYVASVAAFEVLREQGRSPAVVAGHSVGEYAALYAAGVFDFATGLRLVKTRSEAMHAASLKRPGGMVAILAMEEADARTVCADVIADKGGVVEVANLNSPGQVVLSGEKHALDLAMRLTRMRGALKTVPLAVAGPWHCSLMKDAEEALAAEILPAPFRDAALPVIANVTATAVTAAAEIKDLLIRQVCGSVRWSDSVRAMLAMGVDHFVEVGSGTVLSGLMKRIDKKAKTEQFG